MKKKKLFVTLAFAVIILGIIGWQIYAAIKLRHSDAWKDAHPTKAQVDSWLLKNFTPDGFSVWNKNPKLEGPTFGDWKTIFNQKYLITPFGEDDWGVSCFSWEYTGKDKKIVSDGPIKMCYLNNIEEDGVFIYVLSDEKGHYGVGEIIQGWGHPDPPPSNFHRPLPIEIANKEIVLSFDVKIRQTNFDQSNPDAWQFVGANLRLKSPDLPKRIVMDLMIYTNKNTVWTEKTDMIYRYQKVLVRDKKEAFGKWKHYDVDISWFVADALRRFKIEHAAPTLKLQSLEILCETMFGECGFYTRNVYLYYR